MRARSCGAARAKKAGTVKPLPFSLDRICPTSLSDQFVDGVRTAIDEGYYRIGDRLPTWRALAKELGVSERVPREAMASLAREGLVVSHQRLGCMIASSTVRRLGADRVRHDCHSKLPQ